MLSLSANLRRALSDPAVQTFKIYDIGFVAPDWSASTAYAVGDMVKHSGVTYAATAAHTNYQPPNGGYWAAIDSVTYLTDWSADIVYGGKTYLAWPVKCGEIVQSASGQINDVALTVGNLDDERLIQNLIENYEIIGQQVVIRQFFKDASNNLIDEPIINTFRVSAAKSGLGAVTFSLSIGFDAFLQSVPRRVILAKFCRWEEFKDANCKYAGVETECDRTWNECLRYGNTLNFGGFPAIISQRLII